MGYSFILKLFISGVLLAILGGCASMGERFLYNKKPAFYAYISGEVKTNKIYHEHYSKVYATPASCQKIITTLLAYKILGKDFRYTTNLYGIKKNGKIQDLIISFAGDPSLTTESLIELLSPIKNTKIRTIILDASLFATPMHSKNLMIDDLCTEYAPPVSAMNIDKNLFTIEKFDEYIKNKISVIMHQLKITGNIIIIKDKAKLPKNLSLISSICSKPLSSILPPALKKSDNLVFDSLYLKIIHMLEPELVEDWQDGDKIIKKLLQDNFAINLDGAYIVDGSGLSRYNRIQPRQLYEILCHGYRFEEFVDALSYPKEIDSTLEKRYNLKYYIRAKTGTMSGISCLCGYKISKNKPKAFVVMVNSFTPPNKDIFPVVDKFVSKCLVK